MSKSKKSPKKVKKSAKSSGKGAASAKKAKAAKPARSSASKSAAKKAKPVKANKKTVKKKEVRSARSSGGKAVKPAKKIAKPSRPAAKKTAKPVKPLKKAKGSKVDVIVVKTKKGAPAKASKAAKPAKPVKATKSVKAPAKPVKPAKAPKGEKIKGSKKKGEEDDDFFSEPEADFAPKAPKSRAGRKPKSKNDDDEPEIVHDELIEQLIQSTKKKKQGPKTPRVIKTFINPMASLAVASDEMDKKGAPKKEPKGKFELEYVIRTSAGILYELISTPSGLSEWFADDVNIRDGYFTFFWDGSEQKAKLLGFKEEKFIRLRWVDKPEGTYFEFRIDRDELTGDISLIIIDFADEASDQQTSKLLWDSQVNKLLGVLGSN
jgi:uncharacterized protein YndB with AHSA1/START domain